MKHKLQEAIHIIHEIDLEAGRRAGKTSIHPAARLFVCLAFVLFTVSFAKYDLEKLIAMGLFLIVLSVLEEISIWQGIKRMRHMIVLLAIMGIANPLFDRSAVGVLGNVTVTGGMISMLTLLIKGVYTVVAAYFLMVQIGIQGICRGLKAFHVPSSMITIVMLTYRYLIVLLKEAARMWDAYSMRAPGQKGVAMKSWGSFAGLLLLRTFDRGKDVYDSMLLRGYDNGSLIDSRIQAKEKKGSSFAYVVFWLICFLVFRFIPLFQLVGKGVSFL